MTYKLELFLVLQKKIKKVINIKSLSSSSSSSSSLLLLLWFTYIGFLVSYTKLTHLVQKLKNLD